MSESKDSSIYLRTPERDDTETTIFGNCHEFSEDITFPDDESTLTEYSTITEIDNENEVSSPLPILRSPLSQSVNFAPIPPPIIIDNIAKIETIMSPRVLPSSSKPLLKGWKEYYDKDSECFYYVHISSGEKTLDRDIACGISPITISDDEEDLSSSGIEVPREYPKLKDSQEKTGKITKNTKRKDTTSKRKRKKSSRSRSRSKSPGSKKEVSKNNK